MDDVGLEGVEGSVLEPSDAGYDAARQTFNGMIDRHPRVIVQCRTTDDVVIAVRAARAAGLPIAVRGGGHGVAGHAMADGALVVDLREMRRVDVDPGRGVARAQGGALWADVDEATTEHGFATTGGTFGDTGIGGLTLTGGIGFLMGTGGFTCDTLVGADVVLADGSVVRAALDGDRELLWALRGGGGNFGVVTLFEYACQPVGEIQLGRFVAPIEHARAGLVAAAELARTMPDELNLFVVGPSFDVAEGVAPDPTRDPQVVVFGLAYQGANAAAEAAIGPLRSVPGLEGAFRPVTYRELQARNAPLPFGLRHYWKGHFVRDLDETAVDAAATAMTSKPEGPSFVLLEAITGQARLEPVGGAAFGQRGARWNVSALGICLEPEDDEAMIEWVRGVADALRPSSFSGAGYGNYGSADEPAERIRASFGPERYARLVAAKRRYDPDNVFRFNHNIPPAG
jgi:FAD/FMN-containing dehydrogenase